MFSLLSNIAESGDTNVSKNDICDIAGVVPDKWVDKLFEVCQTKTFENLEDYVNDITCEGSIRNISGPGHLENFDWQLFCDTHLPSPETGLEHHVQL